MSARSIVFLGLAGLLLWWAWPETSITHAPGVLVADAPGQSHHGEGGTIRRGAYRLMPRAEFALTARVLGRENYRFDREADLSPMDLALGWGAMSDQAVLDQVEISQGNRFYHWRAENYPIPRREIERSSANMHMIPASDSVARAMDHVTIGQLIRIHGQLVDVQADDGWQWRTSLTRDDTGAGACEVVLVRAIEIADSASHVES